MLKLTLLFILQMVLGFSVNSWGAPNTAASTVNGDPSLVSQAWYIERIELPRAWRTVRETPDVPVGVIDMDFDLSHEELKEAFDDRYSLDFSGKNFSEISLDAKYSQHGTLVSAIIGANGVNAVGITGISQRARMIAINVAPVGKAIDIEEVMRYTIDSGAKVINCSFGYVSIKPDLMEKLRRALRYAQEKDVLIVAAAGNYGRDNDKEPFYPSSFSVEFPNVISVGATAEDDSHFYASSYGKKHVDIFAPGRNIIVPADATRYVLSSGTSEAAPIVSGVASLMRQINPRLSAAQVKKILMQTSDKKEQLRAISVSGGRVNAARAVEAAEVAR
ncbi:S8 family serine peptidase [Pseudobdellovibrio exovorus]|uniref:Peptidase S8/S53 domain-containing protein n=1 Tax=Pseudobdellovibrio exovorus JSS TaxID=1184267 RepID=M4VAZ5_9BACT|nr:S8 family serine peptidase [Pseudobdellovibrio exovorus]AGH95645.1 hypothetical protein A11Q_1429 [Pseudobdellovibrio exovorus JSS]